MKRRKYSYCKQKYNKKHTTTRISSESTHTFSQVNEIKNTYNDSFEILHRRIYIISTSEFGLCVKIAIRSITHDYPVSHTPALLPKQEKPSSRFPSPCNKPNNHPVYHENSAPISHSPTPIHQARNDRLKHHKGQTITRY